MTKIKEIFVKNLKAIGAMKADFNGCSAIITAGNRKGKSTFLRSLPDRIRGEKPEIIVKDGEENGEAELVLTSGEKFTWSFTKDGKEKLAFITKEGYRTAITKEVAQRFFPPLFDIDKFLTSQPKEQSKQLQKALGLDLLDLDLKYKAAFDERTIANRLVSEAKSGLLVPYTDVPAEPIVVTDKELKVSNNSTVAARRKEVVETLIPLGTSEFKLIEEEKAIAEEEKRIAARKIAIKEERKAIEVNREAINNRLATDPELKVLDETELQALETEIQNAKQINEYIAHNVKAAEKKAAYDKAVEKAQKDDEAVKTAEKERSDKIKSVTLPDGLSFGEDGLLFNNLPLDKKSLATSEIYIIALKLAAMNIGEVKSLYFDASPLDRESLEAIEAWAEGQGLQLLIELPSFEGGEIEYKILAEVADNEVKETLF